VYDKRMGACTIYSLRIAVGNQHAGISPLQIHSDVKDSLALGKVGATETFWAKQDIALA
jgi:hypothetical protein